MQTPDRTTGTAATTGPRRGQGQPARRPGHTGQRIRAIVLYGVLVCLALTVVLPFAWSVFASLKPLEEVQSTTWVPRHWQPDNYLYVLGAKQAPGFGSKSLDIQFGKWYFNSLFIAGWVTLLQVTTSALAAYAFSRLEWPGRDRVFMLYLATMMVPGLVVSIPNFALMFRLGLYNTYRGLIVPGAFSAFGTFLLRQFMLTIPKSLDEAAEIDGASPWRTFWDVILPLARPGVLTLAIFTFMGTWASFFWPLIMIKSEYLRTLPIGMMVFNSSYTRQTNLLMAGTVMTTVPRLLLFVILQRYLVRGIQLGAVKG